MRSTAEVVKRIFLFRPGGRVCVRASLIIAALLYSLSLIVLPCTEAVAARVADDTRTVPSVPAAWEVPCTTNDTAAQHPEHRPDALCCIVSAAVPSDDVRMAPSFGVHETAAPATVTVRLFSYAAASPDAAQERAGALRPHVPLYVRILHLLI